MTQASIGDWISFFGTSDVGFYFSQDQMGADLSADPWAIGEKYLEKSHLRCVKNVKTPTMTMHSFENYKSPLEQGLQFYTAPQYLGKESELILLKGSHALLFGGNPKAKTERLKHIVRWFNKYLKQ